MLCEAASPWHLDLHILDKHPDYPAGKVAPNFHVGDFTDYDDVLQFGRQVEIVTIEIEKVNYEALVELEQQGKIIIPSSEVVRIIRDKGLQKKFYRDNRFPTADFELYDSKKAIWQAILIGHIEYPFVQKSRRGGYDGRGVAVIQTEEDLPKLMDTPSVVESCIDIKKELALIVARNPAGQITTFPLVEMEFSDEANLVNTLICPAQVDPSIQQEAVDIGLRLAESLQLTGLLAIEFFLDKKDTLLINEVAPRPHNSGHHTIEACTYSQYDVHLRCLLNLDLPEIQLNHPAAMYNVLGADGYTGAPKFIGVQEILGQEGVYLHWYGKKETRPHRKMGHITIIDKDIEGVRRKLEFIKEKIKVVA